MTSAAELVEVVDKNGDVVEIVTRAEIREHSLRHRSTYVVVLTKNHEIVVHQRASWKDVYPSYWDIAFGGICGVGEPWSLAAKRELLEEAGLDVENLFDLGQAEYEADDGSILGRVFVAFSDEEVTCPDGEVVQANRIPVAKLSTWMEEHQVCTDSKKVVLPKLLKFLESSSPESEH